MTRKIKQYKPIKFGDGPLRAITDHLKLPETPVDSIGRSNTI